MVSEINIEVLCWKGWQAAEKLCRHAHLKKTEVEVKVKCRPAIVFSTVTFRKMADFFSILLVPLPALHLCPQNIQRHPCHDGCEAQPPFKRPFNEAVDGNRGRQYNVTQRYKGIERHTIGSLQLREPPAKDYD